MAGALTRIDRAPSVFRVVDSRPIPRRRQPPGRGWISPPTYLTAGEDRRWVDDQCCKHAGGVPLRCAERHSAQQKWPSRNIEIIIPFSPGSGVDLIGRAVAAALTERSARPPSCSTARARPARSASRCWLPRLPTDTRWHSGRRRRSRTRPIWSKACATTSIRSNTSARFSRTSSRSRSDRSRKSIRRKSCLRWRGRSRAR